MKKLLTLLLTLIMAVCLINLNNNHTKAENANHTIGFDGTAISPSPKWTGIPASNVPANDTITIENNDGGGANVYVHLADGTTDTIESGYSKMYTIKYGINIADLNAQDDGNINLFDGIASNGLLYDGAITETNTGWLETTDGTSGTYTPIRKDSGRLAELGITMNGTTAKFSKNIYCNTGEVPTIAIESPLTIEISKNLSISNTADNECLALNSAISEPIIKGNGHTLTLISGGNFTMKWNTKVTLDNITMVAQNNASMFFSTFYGTKDLVLEGDCTIDIKNINSGGYAFSINENKKVESNRTPIGAASDGRMKEIELKQHPNLLSIYVYAVKDTGDYATHILLTNVSPKPVDPTPKKDESCEKVIGPTWHWNNEKGICEEYSTVGTSTR